MCMRALCTRGCGSGMGASSVGRLGLDSLILKRFKRPGVTLTPLLDALWHSRGIPPRPDATAINGVVAWTQLPCSPPFVSFLPRAPLLIWAHLPPQGRRIKFLFQHWSGGVGGKQLTGSGRATLAFLSACQEQRLLARQHCFCSVCPQLRAGQPQRHPGGVGHLQHLCTRLKLSA